VERSVAEKLTAELLSVRHADLTGKANAQSNYYILSGMLIGSELAYLKEELHPVFLSTSNPLSNLYVLALKHLISEDRVRLIEPADFKKASFIGHQKILKRHYEHE